MGTSFSILRGCFFNNVTAEAGGGKLSLNGSVTYGNGPLRYSITAVTPTIRIRYPAGMSWLTGGTLQLSGTTDAAVLSGNIQVQRLLFAEGVDVASFFATSSENPSGSGPSSPFMRNLTFDIEGQTTPGRANSMDGRADRNGWRRSSAGHVGPPNFTR